MRLSQRANADPGHRYAIFIDEINRGNISKIFGELISLIEVDKRAGMPNAMSLQLAYSGDHFSVPANVDIIGVKWFTEFGHLNRGDMLTSEQHRCHNEKKKFQRRV
ncbi:hypothetical protein ECOLIN_26265 [Escherichia coli Nissle 1917]|nr:hypothetical protein ECOLIN_26265 [Escherichia coli Nissle 1917]